MRHLITKLSECDAIVEATSEEGLGLWCRYASNSNYTHDRGGPRLNWIEQSSGFWREIGKVADRPICVSVFFATVAERRIAFVEGCSELVDHKMIRDWIATEKRDDDVPVVNASNFHNALPRAA